MSGEHEIYSRITALVEEEKVLRSRLQKGEISTEEENGRLSNLEVQLDQCWDLLRQRRALAGSGHNPDEAHVRPANQVEGYLS
jgi:hypothetical protein